MARVLSSRVVRVKIWTAAGTVVYSDAHALIGKTFPLGSDEQEALAEGQTDSELSDLSRPENRYERSFGRLVEVYLPVRSLNGTKLLFETYQLDSAIQADQQRIWSGVFPALLQRAINSSETDAGGSPGISTTAPSRTSPRSASRSAPRRCGSRTRAGRRPPTTSW